MAKKGTNTETPIADKAAKFVELANKRGGKGIKAIETLGSLANTRNYDFTADQAAKLIAVLRGKVDALEAAFNDALAGKTVAAPGQSDIL
jgi:hypothetical protein